MIHVGAGLGYYSAILAEIVGPTGEVTAIEIDPGLAERARANLARSWPQAKVIATDGFAFQADEPVDAIVVNAGVSHLALPWLDSLKGDGGRLLVPLTNANLWGAFLVVERWGARYPVHCASRVGIIACTGGRDAEAEARLAAALARADYTAVKSLRRPPEEPDDTCWLAGEGWWLSTAPAGNAPGISHRPREYLTGGVISNRRRPCRPPQPRPLPNRPTRTAFSSSRIRIRPIAASAATPISGQSIGRVS